MITPPRIVAHFADEIRAYHAAEMDRRRKYWIAGVPTSADVHAVDLCVARKLKTTAEDVRTAVDAVLQAPSTPVQGPFQ